MLKHFFDTTRKLFNSGPAMEDCPALIHVTHWKAGSQWVRKILQECLPERFVEPQVCSSHFVGQPILEGRVYPTVYLTREEFEKSQLPNRWVRFVVIRDLRDTLVSAYFSLRYSHSSITEFINETRNTLATMDVESGMIYLLERWLPDSTRIQSSWLAAGERLIHFEDLISPTGPEIFDEILLKEAGFPISRDQLQNVFRDNRFENLAGRKPGQEDVNKHMRKGIVGDWQNHFTPRLKDEFRKYYGSLLVATDYEKDFNW